MATYADRGEPLRGEAMQEYYYTAFLCPKIEAFTNRYNLYQRYCG